MPLLDAATIATFPWIPSSISQEYVVTSASTFLMKAAKAIGISMLTIGLLGMVTAMAMSFRVDVAVARETMIQRLLIVSSAVMFAGTFCLAVSLIDLPKSK
jgi:hypothetical protein